jgi:hypothetical protein
MKIKLIKGGRVRFIRQGLDESGHLKEAREVLNAGIWLNQAKVVA